MRNITPKYNNSVIFLKAVTTKDEAKKRNRYKKYLKDAILLVIACLNSIWKNIQNLFSCRVISPVIIYRTKYNVQKPSQINEID